MGLLYNDCILGPIYEIDHDVTEHVGVYMLQTHLVYIINRVLFLIREKTHMLCVR